MNKKINKKTKIAEILKIKGAEEVLSKYSLPCLSCPMGKFEIESLEIGRVAEMYNLDIDNIIKEINRIN